MGFGYSGFPGGEEYIVKDYYPVDKGDNNGLQVSILHDIKQYRYLMMILIGYSCCFGTHLH